MESLPEVKSSESKIVTAPQNKYGGEQKVYAHPEYLFNTVNPNSFGQAININASETSVTIMIPPEVFNLAQSFLQFRINLPAPAAGNFIWTYADTWSMISRMQLYVQGTDYLCDLGYLQNYMKIILKRETCLEEFLTHDVRDRFYPSNTLANAVPALRRATGAPFLHASSLPYREPAYFEVGAVASDVNMECMLPLKMLKNTIFAVDKDLYFGKVCYLKIFFGPLARIAYMSTSNASPSAGTPTAYVPAAGNATVNDLQLVLALEQSKGLAESVKSKVMSGGLSMYIPYVISNKINYAAATNQTVNFQFDANQGATLRKVIHSLFHNTESEDTAYDCDNTGGGGNVKKVNEFTTTLNGNKEQQLTIDTRTNPSGGVSTSLYYDYLNMKRQLKGSVIQNRNIYQNNWHWCSDYTEIPPICQQDGSADDLLAGIPMSMVPLTWSFVGSNLVSAAYNHYNFAIFSRRLVINPQMAKLE